MNDKTSITFICVISILDLSGHRIGGPPISTNHIKYCSLLGSAEGVLEPLFRQKRVKHHPEVPIVLSGRSNLQHVDGGV